MSIITCTDVVLGYEKNPILENLNFSVEKEDYLTVIGENGTGKSTLMKGILGLHPPLRGEITLGEGLTHRDIGYLPQQTPAQRDFPASVEEIVRSGCQARCGFRPFYNQAEKQLAEENIVRMGIENLRKRAYRTLSGGQQQRVLLARALCATQKILLLDEPATGLDPKVTEDLYQLISKLHSEGVTILMISHDMTSALAYSTKILRLTQPVFFGSLSQYHKYMAEEMTQQAKVHLEKEGGK